MAEQVSDRVRLACTRWALHKHRFGLGQPGGDVILFLVSRLAEEDVQLSFRYRPAGIVYAVGARLHRYFASLHSHEASQPFGWFALLVLQVLHYVIEGLAQSRAPLPQKNHGCPADSRPV